MSKDEIIKALVDRLNAVHSAIDSATYTMEELKFNDLDVYTELHCELKPTEELLEKIKQENTETTEKEVRVYLVDSMNDVESWEELPDEEFIRMAEAEGKVYSLQGFVKAFNEEEINTFVDFIRII